MSIEQLNKIDIISTSKSGKIQMTISDHLKWNDMETHLLVLQKKINAYLDYIESDQIYEDYPDAKNKELVICLTMKYEPNKESLPNLEKIKTSILESGIEFNWNIAKV